MKTPHDALAGLDPLDLLRNGAAADTLADSEGTAFTPPSIAELTEIFPQFQILSLIGKGGMGAVYQVRQRELDRIVALKILPPAIGQRAGFAERFTREAKALAKLNHPGIVTLYEFGQADGLYFILMEFVDGVNLRELLAHGRISPREALAIVPQICDALQFAHDRGIIHRDIKPENILLDRLGRVKVADFGLAKLAGDEITCDPAGISPNDPLVTEAGKLMGTPQYMAPEQIETPSAVDHRVDIYALGVVLYQMLTGEFPGKKIEAPSMRVKVDVRLDKVVLRALEKKPELRFQQASNMKTKIEDSQGTPFMVRPGWRKPAAAVSIILLCAGAWLSLDRSSSQEIPKKEAITPAVPAADHPAVAAALAWLDLIDKKSYPESWQQASEFFRKSVTAELWKTSLEMHRTPLGDLVSRKLKQSQELKSPAGAPEGLYLVMQFEAEFSNKKPVIETVTFFKETDEKWRASGYFIK